MNPPDPDRFFNRTSPGAHEWWYFDAISDDGRDALVIVWYAGLPFDPSYGVATLRHLRDPAKYPQPRALDHSAIGFSWHRDGKPIAYALNGHKADQFRHQAEPFAVEVATSRVERDDEGYKLTVATPTVEGRAIRAEFRFHPANSTEPFERDLGSPEAPHDWILAASDCRVEGKATIGDQSSTFTGRGYHDHNAGAEDLSIAMKRWEWGRVHLGSSTHIYYRSEPHRGASRALWITCLDGRPARIREGEGLEFKGVGRTRRNVFGLRRNVQVLVTDGAGHLVRATEGETLIELADGSRRTVPSTARLLDDGPFYQRWLADFAFLEGRDEHYLSTKAPGIAEVLDTRNLHRPWFNWMIPYRLKWPGS